VTFIPQKATFEVLDKKFIYVVDKDGLVEAKEIVIEGEINHIYLIKEGVSPTSQFLIEGIRKVKSGDKIKFEKVSAEAVFSNLALHAE
jgi:membrane fusion protein (multidrug efflux system)